MENRDCAVCGHTDEQWVLVQAFFKGDKRLFCMQCLHALIHGISPDELKRRLDAQNAPHPGR